MDIELRYAMQSTWALNRIRSGMHQVVECCVQACGGGYAQRQVFGSELQGPDDSTRHIPSSDASAIAGRSWPRTEVHFGDGSVGKRCTADVVGKYPTGSCGH